MAKMTTGRAMILVIRHLERIATQLESAAAHPVGNVEPRIVVRQEQLQGMIQELRVCASSLAIILEAWAGEGWGDANP